MLNNKRVRVGYSMRLTKPEPPPPEPPKPEPDPRAPEPPKPEPSPTPEPPEPVVPELVLPEIGCGRIAIEKQGEEQVVVGFVGTQEDPVKIQEAVEKSKARVEVALRP